MTAAAHSIDVLHARKTLGRTDWSPPWEIMPGSWGLRRHDGQRPVVLSAAPWNDGVVWIHASIAGRTDMPTYEELTTLHAAVFRAGYAYQVFAPPDQHVNIHEYALHLWGRADGAAGIPEFGVWGTV